MIAGISLATRHLGWIICSFGSDGFTNRVWDPITAITYYLLPRFYHSVPCLRDKYFLHAFQLDVELGPKEIARIVVWSHGNVENICILSL